MPVNQVANKQSVVAKFPFLYIFKGAVNYLHTHSSLVTPTFLTARVPDIIYSVSLTALTYVLPKPAYNLLVSRSSVRPGTSLYLTRSQSGRTKHVFPSRVYTNTCLLVLWSSYKIKTFRICAQTSSYIGSHMPCHSVRQG